MNTLRYVGVGDEPLTKEQGTYINTVAIKAAQLSLKGRQIFGSAIRNIDPGAQSYGYDKENETAPAAVDFSWPGRLSLDIQNFERDIVPIPNLHAETEINKLDLASSRMNGTPLNTSGIENRARQVARLIDEMLIKGYSNNNGASYIIKGLYTSAANDLSSALPFSNPTNIPDAINAASAMLLSSGREGPYNLILHPNQYSLLSPFIGSTATTYKNWVNETIGGQIIISDTIKAGTAMMAPVNPQGAYEIVISEDLTTETGITTLKEGSNLFARIYFRGLPVIYDTKAICKLSNIG
ncbi:MAG: bacteriocin family protein [Candidatus Bathyarchaeota archaeon]|nr:bacteriocin family protein [Candidatus Termiticorpusculum sp.]